MVNHNTDWKEQMEYYGVLSDAQEVYSNAGEEGESEQMSDQSHKHTSRE